MPIYNIQCLYYTNIERRLSYISIANIQILSITTFCLAHTLSCACVILHGYHTALMTRNFVYANGTSAFKVKFKNIFTEKNLNTTM